MSIIMKSNINVRWLKEEHILDKSICQTFMFFECCYRLIPGLTVRTVDTIRKKLWDTCVMMFDNCVVVIVYTLFAARTSQIKYHLNDLYSNISQVWWFITKSCLTNVFQVLPSSCCFINIFKKSVDFPRRENKKSNNDVKHAHGQEKRRPSGYVEGNNCKCLIFYVVLRYTFSSPPFRPCLFVRILFSPHPSRFHFLIFVLFVPCPPFVVYVPFTSTSSPPHSWLGRVHARDLDTRLAWTRAG